MNKSKTIIRIVLGVMMLIFGFNTFLNFIPMPPMEGAAGEFMGALVKSGYIMTIIAVVEIIAGFLFLINKFVPQTLVVLFPVLLNAFLFHLFLDVAGIGAAALAIAMNVFLLFANKEPYLTILKS